MSTSIRWQPTGSGKGLKSNYSFPLKDALREEYGHGAKTLDSDDLPFLRGLRAAKIDGANELIELVEKHESIDVWEES